MLVGKLDGKLDGLKDGIDDGTGVGLEDGLTDGTNEMVGSCDGGSETVGRRVVVVGEYVSYAWNASV